MRTRQLLRHRKPDAECGLPAPFTPHCGIHSQYARYCWWCCMPPAAHKYNATWTMERIQLWPGSWPMVTNTNRSPVSPQRNDTYVCTCALHVLMQLVIKKKHEKELYQRWPQKWFSIKLCWCLPHSYLGHKQCGYFKHRLYRYFGHMLYGYFRHQSYGYFRQSLYEYFVYLSDFCWQLLGYFEHRLYVDIWGISCTDILDINYMRIFGA